MKYHQPVYLPLLMDALLVFAIAMVWHAFAFAQCAPSDLNCMNLP